MRATWRGTAAGAAAVALLAGCGGGGESQAASDTDAVPETTAAPSQFVDPRSAANKWLPLKPGTRWVREGTTLIGKREVAHKVVSTVTDVMREVDGVKTLLVLDEEYGGGELVDRSLDYLAQDAAGAIWWYGAVTEEYEAGRLVGIDEAWLAGRKGAKAGIFVPAVVDAGTPKWLMARPPGEKADVAKFLKTVSGECVPFGCYDDVLVVEEGSKDKSEIEDKYYAAGVGQIRNSPAFSRDSDLEKLANLTQLTPEGLTEASTEALRIDASAVEEESEVFGTTKAARAT